MLKDVLDTVKTLGKNAIYSKMVNFGDEFFILTHRIADKNKPTRHDDIVEYKDNTYLFSLYDLSGLNKIAEAHVSLGKVDRYLRRMKRCGIEPVANKVVYLEYIFVEEPYQNRGIGGMLLNCVIEDMRVYAREKNIPFNIILETVHGPQADSFYSKWKAEDYQQYGEFYFLIIKNPVVQKKYAYKKVCHLKVLTSKNKYPFEAIKKSEIICEREQ